MYRLTLTLDLADLFFSNGLRDWGYASFLEVPPKDVEDALLAPGELGAQLFAMCWIYQFSDLEDPGRSPEQWGLALCIVKAMDCEMPAPTSVWAQLNARLVAKAGQQGFQHEALARVEVRTFPRSNQGGGHDLAAAPTPPVH